MVVTLDREAYEKSFADLDHEFKRDALRVIIARAEALEFDSIAAGVWKEVTIPWDRAGDDPEIIAAQLDQLLVVQTGGVAANFDWKILTKAGGSGLDQLDDATGQTAPLRHPFASPGRIFLSEETGTDKYKIVLAIKPNGAGGSYKVRIYGRPLR